MKAVVLTESRELELADIPDPTPGPDEVVVRPDHCGICGTDLHARELEILRAGVVLGHEFAGEVVAVGPGVDDWAVGEAVVANPNGHVCGECRFCRVGRYNLCPVATQQRPLGVQRDGGLAEYVALHTSYLRRLPAAVDTRRGAWVEPLAVAVRAVRTSPVRIGDSVAVIGAGPVGQLVVQMLRAAGATQVLVVEPSAHRRETAIRVGASTTATPGELAGMLADGAEPRIDHVLECSGHPTALQTGVDLVAAGGTMRMVGMPPSRPAFDAAAAIMKEVSIESGFIYVDEFEMAIDLLERDAIDVDVLTSTVVGLADFAAAFAALHRPEETVKALIRTADGR